MIVCSVTAFIIPWRWQRGELVVWFSRIQPAPFPAFLSAAPSCLEAACVEMRALMVLPHTSQGLLLRMTKLSFSIGRCVLPLEVSLDCQTPSKFCLGMEWKLKFTVLLLEVRMHVCKMEEAFFFYWGLSKAVPMFGSSGKDLFELPFMFCCFALSFARCLKFFFLGGGGGCCWVYISSKIWSSQSTM